eukprot:CAMPEP_0182441272 /NCGR_PEP_ID=MMETSP1172-20130603/214_1 /TAXON_ID=708627 /ORGANISM="Timspurckia oligopyrenoides, Strain CCMP3278" /LENGTH=385 /DNA_ID=CAMNT_0024635453 /DNA_START=492 /DNA_END=1649 /DNA_ORIENTATION=-
MNGVNELSFEVFISQDLQSMNETNTEEYEKLVSVSATIQSMIQFAELKCRNIRIQHWIHDQSFEKSINSSISNRIISYTRISRHYFYALWRIFSLKATHDTIASNVQNGSQFSMESMEELDGLCGNKFRFDHVILLEDDMEVGSDIFEYFEAMKSLLEIDDSLYCVSAWNDNGVEARAHDHRTLHRSDWFPGLGWMLNRKLWMELRQKWPVAFWDDWMRESKQRKNRKSIRPEMSRTRNYGLIGVSSGMYFDKHISQVILSTEYIPFHSNVTERFHAIESIKRDNYHATFYSRLSNATRFRFASHIHKYAPIESDIIVWFPTGKLEKLSKIISVMPDQRDGVWRGSYNGIVVFGYHSKYWGFAVPRNYSELQLPEGTTIGRCDYP